MPDAMPFRRIEVDRAIAADPSRSSTSCTVRRGTWRSIAWTIDGAMDPPMGHVYGYRLEAIDGGTLVTSYYDWSNLHPTYEAFADTFFPVISETNLRATLGILARTAAPGASRPGA
jgi:hypothetical protein